MIGTIVGVYCDCGWLLLTEDGGVGVADGLFLGIWTIKLSFVLV